MPPESFDEEWAPDWDHWVLAHGLPELPGPQIAIGESVPVAFWIGPRTAAILHIRRIHGRDEPDPYAETDVALYGLVDGIWRNWGGGGAGGWSGDAMSPSRVPVRSVNLNGRQGSWLGDRGCKALWGEVGAEAAVAEVEQSGQVTRRRIEAPTGLYVVSAEYDEPVTVRVFDSAGEILATIEEEGGFSDQPPWWSEVR